MRIQKGKKENVGCIIWPSREGNSMLRSPLDVWCIITLQVPYDRDIWRGFSNEAYDFTSSLLRRQSGRRPSAAEAFEHPWIQMHLDQYGQQLKKDHAHFVSPCDAFDFRD